MSPNTAAIVGLILLFVLMALRMPVSFAMILAGFLGNAYMISTDAAIYMLTTNVWDQLSSYGLSVIPLFVFMGQLAFHSGITERLYNAAYKWVGRLPGGLAGTTILSSASWAAPPTCATWMISCSSPITKPRCGPGKSASWSGLRACA